MKILFVYANTNKLLYPPPVGAAMVMQNALENGHECRLLDFMSEKNPDTKLNQAMTEFQPHLVAFSLRNLDNQDPVNPVSYISDYIRWVSLAGNGPFPADTVIGGSAFTTCPVEMMAAIPASFGFTGQGEATFYKFLEEYETGAADFKTPGVVWRRGKDIKKNPPLINGYAEGGKIPWHHIDRKKYEKSYYPWGIITKTGCPFDCLFCDTHVTFGNRFITRNPDEIVEELQENQKQYRFNRRTYMFIDDIFNEPLEWAKELLEKIISTQMYLGFSVIMEPTSFDRELIRLLVRAGCTMGTGLLVSGSDRVLEKNKKTFTVEKIEEFLQLCRVESFPFMPQFMLGSPGETKTTIEETFSMVNRFRLPMVETGIGVRIQKQTELYNHALKTGLLTGEENLMYPHFYIEPGLSIEWLTARASAFQKKYKRSYRDWWRMIRQSLALMLKN